MGAYPFGVIIIDDDVVDVEAISRSLLCLDSPPHIVVFQTASEALQALQNQKQLFQPPVPFVILLELELPVMTGLDFLAHIRNDASLRGIRVFVLTSSDLESEQVAAYDLGVAAYLRKSALPDSSKAVAALIEAYMRTVLFPEERGPSRGG
jgi:CheY-like chemotaxis protein